MRRASLSSVGEVWCPRSAAETIATSHTEHETRPDRKCGSPLPTYLHFHRSLLLPKVVFLLFDAGFGFGAVHVGQSLLGAQLGDGGRRGHPVVDAGRRLRQL